MDKAKRLELIDRVKALRLLLPDCPRPLVTLEEFFEGNDDCGSIGCNLSPMPVPRSFYDRLRSIRSQPKVQDILVEISEILENDQEAWPFSDTIYIYADAILDEVLHWAAALQPDAVEEILIEAPYVSELKRDFRCYRLWWD